MIKENNKLSEKRKFNRLYLNGSQKAVIANAGIREEVDILDISAGGICISSLCPIAIGTPVCGEFKILSQNKPFFISGQVIRAIEKRNQWDMVVQFDKVQTTPFI